MRKLKNSELDRKSISEFKEAHKVPVILVLDNVRSQNNVGSIFRTADAFLVEAIYLCGITAVPPHRDIQKTALGAAESVKWDYFEDTRTAINLLKKNNYSIIAIEQAEGSLTLQDFTPDPKESYAIVFGHEIKGVQQQIVDLANKVIEIPQYGTKHSFNIAVSVGIVLWDLHTKKQAIP